MGKQTHRVTSQSSGIQRNMQRMLLPFLFLLCLTLPAMGERVQQVTTKTSSCFSCGMIEGTSYLTVKICGRGDCCLSRSLDNDDLNWLPGQTDRFHGPESLLECADFEVGSGPFDLTAFHDGPDGLTLDWIEVRTEMRTVRCHIDHKLDDHSFVKSHCN